MTSPTIVPGAPNVSGDLRPSHLKRILGLSFGLAVIFGGTVGVGILRLPGVIAGQMGSFWLIQMVWILGGAYSLLGALSVSELAAALPSAGGFYVYARRAFGPAAGFAVGWADWLNCCASVAYGAVAAGEYLAALVPALAPWQRPIAVGLILFFCAMQWYGLRLSSGLQKLSSFLTAITFLALAAACLLHPAAAAAPAAHPLSLIALLAPLVSSLRAVVVAYDGWYNAVYFAEEDTNAARNLPRAMIGSVFLIVGLYLLLNLAFLHVLSIPALAASKLPAADAARIVFPAWSGQFVTILSLLTLLSLINAVLLCAPRVLYAIGRDGLFPAAALRVDAGGTPRAVLLISAAMALIFVLSGHFDEIISVAALLIAAMYCVNYLALFRLRRREPSLARPFRTWGYPWTTALVLIGSLLFLVADVRDDPGNALRAIALMIVAVPAYLWMRHNRMRQN